MTNSMIDETESDLIWLIAKDFGRPPNPTELPAALLDWLHYRARLISPVGREVKYAKGVLTSLTSGAPMAEVDKNAVFLIAANLLSGADVAPYLSDRIVDRKEDHKADLGPLAARATRYAGHVAVKQPRQRQVRAPGV